MSTTSMESVPIVMLMLRTFEENVLAMKRWSPVYLTDFFRRTSVSSMSPVVTETP